MKNITFITGNKGKLEEVSRHLHIPVTHHKLDLIEIQSLDLAEIVRDKAQRAYDILQLPVLIEDTSLTFAALGKLPGPLIKWFLQEVGNDGLTKLLGENRSATAEVLFGLHDGTSCHLFSGIVHGSIAETPRGDNDFGWGPVFIPEGETRTWGEMTADEKVGTSMRRIALGKLEAFLTT